MKRIFYGFLFSFILVMTAQANTFIEGFEDIPLMDNLKQLSTDDFSFENEEVGYKESILISRKKLLFNDIKEFYIDILPQLGWNLQSYSEDQLIFARDNDILEFRVLKKMPLKVSVILKKEN